jgi:MFS family permease
MLKPDDDNVRTETIGTGTICCGIAPSMEALIAARAVAGMGGGGFVLVFGKYCLGS